MELTRMECCAFHEIKDLSEHGNAADAMAAFLNIVETNECDDDYNMKPRLDLGAFYVFTAMVKCDGVALRHRYGHDFAEFIRKNKLGVLKETQTRFNRQNEPTHQIHGWIWTPSLRNLTKYWKEKYAD